MRLARHAVILCLLLASLGVGLALDVLAEGPIELTIYSSPTCEDCIAAKDQVLDPLKQTYGELLQYDYVDLSTPEGLAELERVEGQFGRANSPLPVIVYGDQFIAGGPLEELKGTLEGLILRELTSSGATELAPDATMAPGQAQAQSATAQMSETEPTIHLAYVEQAGCQECARAQLVIEALRSEYPQLVVTKLNDSADAALIEAMGAHLGVPEDLRLLAPAVYVNGDILRDAEITTANLRAILAKHASSGAPAFWEDLDPEEGKRTLIQQFEQIGLLAIVLAALVDGINPCAFATILFFVSYLAISRRKRSALLAVGFAFTAGVFCAYLAVGLGALELLTLLNSVSFLRVILYGVLALSCFVLAGISLYDYVLARQGKLHEMRLNLPEPLRERIKGRIRSTSGAFVGAAFVSGLLVSLLELACTGQVYLPMLSFLAGMQGMVRLRAIGYLIIYNLIFILPLILVLLMATYGVSAVRFQDWFVKNAAKAKLIMAVLFTLLGVLLLLQVLRF
jgi:cytochrome c biogenesis protein CcdA/glutaredoxin